MLFVPHLENTLPFHHSNTAQRNILFCKFKDVLLHPILVLALAAHL